MIDAPKYLNRLRHGLTRAMTADRQAIARELARLTRAGARVDAGTDFRQRLLRLEGRLQASIRRREWRLAHRPCVTGIPELPITASRDAIIAAIRRQPVTIVAGETGSGKTTQIPQFCLEAGRGIAGLIGCTQPRRIAATTVASRIAEELGEEVGRSVGYKIRFTDRTREETFIKIMTDGILLAEAHTDPYLNRYDTLIVDEAHERSLNIDFILGLLRGLIKKRPELRLVITSATIDTEKFSRAFDGAPVIEVSGRMYPVEVRYAELDGGASDEEELTHVEGAVRALETLLAESPSGDVLIFMPTEQDIRDTCELIDARAFRRVTVLPLFARLSAAEQTRVFAGVAGRKIIVATNVAETSITIPGIKYVIDTGLARISRYSPRSRTTALPVVPVSRSSADQRKGRCGRVADGVCVRLFSEEDYQARSLFTPPEILRSNLAEVILRMIALDLGEVKDFPFVDPPAPKSIADGFDLLVELGAIVSQPSGRRRNRRSAYGLTPVGRRMARIPLDPRLARILIEAQRRGCLPEAAVIAAALSIQDPRERPLAKTPEADRAHAAFNDSLSDFVALLNIWDRFQATLAAEKSVNRMKKFCRAHFLSFRRMREWRDIHGQILTMLEEERLQGPVQTRPAAPAQAPESPFGERYATIHKSLLSGLLSNVALKKEKHLYTAARGRPVMVFPGSGLFKSAGTWIVAAELVETTRLFARRVATIDSAWLEEVGQAQCRYTYLEPHWERSRGEVVALERVTLHGLVIEPGRPVSYGRIDSTEAAAIFVRSALVEGDLRSPLPFTDHNREQIEAVRDLENRLRRRDLLVDEETLADFYRERLPGVYDLRTLASLIKEKGGDGFLRLNREDLLRNAPDLQTLEGFPDRVRLGGDAFACLYEFEPGSDADGVTVRIPSTLAPAVAPESLDWLVPGLLCEKVAALIKGLPKEFRKRLVPVARTAEIIADELPRGEGAFLSTLSRFIHARFGVDIPAAAWPQANLPDHLKLRISITGPRGETLRAGRDRSVLRVDLPAPRGDTAEYEAARKAWERERVTDWDFGDLPEVITLSGAQGGRWAVYPALCKTEDGVGLRLFRDRRAALEAHGPGVAALGALRWAKELRFLKKRLALPAEVRPAASYFGGFQRVEGRLYDSLLEELFGRNLRTRTAFEAQAERELPKLLQGGEMKLTATIALLHAHHETRTTLHDLEKGNRANPAVLAFLSRRREDLAGLVPESFLQLYEAERLTHVARYLRAIAVRARRALLDFEKDRARELELSPYAEALRALVSGLFADTSTARRREVEALFWLIEEFKVALFAQELKTAVPVSPKRLAKKLSEIKRMV